MTASITVYGARLSVAPAPSWGLGIDMWVINGTYQEYGYALSAAASLQYAVERPSQGHSNVKLKEIYSRPEENTYAGAGNGWAYPERSRAHPKNPENPENPPEDGQPVTLVDLICTVNESLAELRTAGDFTTSTEYSPPVDGLGGDTVRGSPYVPVLDFMTNNTELEFPIGDPMALLFTNSIVYQFDVRLGTCSMISTLEDQGYYSVAVHPYPGENWNWVEYH